jgi:farnesyl diphosphate synthase
MIDNLSLNLEEAFNQVASIVDKRIDELLPKSDKFDESKLIKAMRYSTLSVGKRIRPFLTIASAKVFKLDLKNVIDVAVAIEFIHVYSLIHDDLPAMDDDDYRRGKLSCHKKFTEATAILAGDSLLTFAFEILSNPDTIFDPHIRCELIHIISKSIGFNGMAGGQMMDLEIELDGNPSPNKIARLHRLKTGEMFMAAVEAGAIIAKAKASHRQCLARYSHDIGLAFQIRDDILDYIGDTSNKIGDERYEHKKTQDKTSIVSIIGMDKATDQLNLLHNQAVSHLSSFGEEADLLRGLSEFIIIRNH